MDLKQEQLFKYAKTDWRECDLGVDINTDDIVLKVKDGFYDVGVKNEAGDVNWCLHSDDFEDINKQTDDAMRFLAVWLKQTGR